GSGEVERAKLVPLQRVKRKPIRTCGMLAAGSIVLIRVRRIRRRWHRIAQTAQSIADARGPFELMQLRSEDPPLGGVFAIVHGKGRQRAQCTTQCASVTPKSFSLS